ncbi:MAG: CRISPR-associated protein Cas1 [Arthrospira sp. PLM2.Bin9]|nr:CRISPR-associated endonuclease Cas1 [Arthrospira sp. PLM2.Bin9]TVU54219.1 MAG: CRISPR-associated protein Cas1 [Arthrospira sp. PLM2.Bin9]
MTVIYLTEPESYLEADAREFVMIIQDQIQSRYPIHDTQQIVVFEGCTVGRSGTAAICRYHIPLFFVGDNGHISAHFTSAKQPIYTALQHQRNCQHNFCISLVQSLLRGRWLNGIKVLQNLGDCGGEGYLEKFLDILPSLNDTQSIQTWHWQISRRYRRTLNSILVSAENFATYWQLADCLLAHELQVLLLASGCSVEIGTLHHHCYNHLPLPCDLMEQFRPIVDAWIVEITQNLGVDEAMKKLHLTVFINHWEEFLNRQIFHPYAGWVSFRNVLSWQVDEYVRTITEAVEYRPFLLKS